jgi:hypothetical protein
LSSVELFLCPLYGPAGLLVREVLESLFRREGSDGYKLGEELLEECSGVYFGKLDELPWALLVESLFCGAGGGDELGEVLLEDDCSGGCFENAESKGVVKS